MDGYAIVTQTLPNVLCEQHQQLLILLKSTETALQCSDAVGWAAGRASGL